MVTEFCRRSQLLGFENNASLEMMKFGKSDLPAPAHFWGVVDKGMIVSVSGCHKIDDHSMRCLYRSATLPEYSNLVPGISKNHMNSLPFSHLLPLQINQGLAEGITEFFVTTTDGTHDASGKMLRTHKALQLLAKNQIVELVGCVEMYDKNQVKWKINLTRYHQALVSFHPVRLKMGISLSEEYFHIIRNGFNKPLV